MNGNKRRPKEEKRVKKGYANEGKYSFMIIS